MTEQDIFCYPDPEETHRLINLRLEYDELIKLGGTAIGGGDDYFRKTEPVEHIDQLRLFEGESE